MQKPFTLSLLVLLGPALVLAAIGLLTFPWAACAQGCITAHHEGLSLSSYGRFQTGFFPRDAFSGELSVYYHFVSGYLRNALAWLIDTPPALLDVFLGRLLIPGFYISVFLGLRLIWVGPFKAAALALLATFFTDVAPFEMLSLILGDGHSVLDAFWAVRPILHTPFNMLETAVADAFALLVAPIVIAAFLRMADRAHVGGVLFAAVMSGALLLTHSLLGLGMLLGALGIEIVLCLTARKETWRWIALLPLALLLFLAQSSTALLVLATSAITAGVWLRAGLKPALVFALTLGAVGAFILAALIRADYLALGGAVLDDSVPWFIQAAVFLPLLGFLGFATRGWRDPVLLAGLSITGMIGVLSLGAVWGFYNHPYRFTTFFVVFAVFPIARAWEMGRIAPRWVSVPLAGWLGLGVLLNIADFGRDNSFAPYTVGGKQLNFRYGRTLIALSAEERAILDRLAEVTRSEGGRPLMVPTVEYPQDSARNGLVASWSQTPGLIGDPRYTRQTSDRPAIFLVCALFGGVDLGDPRQYRHHPDRDALGARCAEGGAVPSKPLAPHTYLILADAGPLKTFATRSDVTPSGGLRLVEIERRGPVSLYEVCMPGSTTPRCGGS